MPLPEYGTEAYFDQGFNPQPVTRDPNAPYFEPEFNMWYDPATGQYSMFDPTPVTAEPEDTSRFDQIQQSLTDSQEIMRLLSEGGGAAGADRVQTGQHYGNLGQDWPFAPSQETLAPWMQQGIPQTAPQGTPPQQFPPWIEGTIPQANAQQYPGLGDPAAQGVDYGALAGAAQGLLDQGEEAPTQFNPYIIRPEPIALPQSFGLLGR